MAKLLLHTCCGPCFLGTWEHLSGTDYAVTAFFDNSNIQPEEEYRKRLAGFQKATHGRAKETIVPEYEPAKHLTAIAGQEYDFPARCLHCWRLRLTETARYAKDNGYDAFSTTLLVSPYQDHEALKRIGEELSEEYGIPFYYYDFRSDFEAGQQTARDLDIYRQKYCGCIYSKEER